MNFKNHLIIEDFNQIIEEILKLVKLLHEKLDPLGHRYAYDIDRAIHSFYHFDLSFLDMIKRIMSITHKIDRIQPDLPEIDQIRYLLLRLNSRGIHTELRPNGLYPDDY